MRSHRPQCGPLPPTHVASGVPSDLPTGGPDRFYVLADAALQALSDGQLDRADALAEELLTVAPHFARNWNYGNAIFHGHTVRGLVAVRRGDVDEARRRLLASAGTPGSPQLNSFGPTMALASDLLERGEAAAVLTYLERCKAFWTLERDRLERWQEAIREKRVADFWIFVCYRDKSRLISSADRP